MVGCFISFEGGEGAGKTSALAQITQELTARGYETIVTREPGGIHISEQIREVILDRAHAEMDGRTEALLYAAARRQHLVERILPALEAGKIVLCDRFIDSSLAYQGHARGLGIDEVLAINEFAIGETYPDLTLFFDVSPEIGLRRIHADDEREINRLDTEAMDFHERVYEGYQAVITRFPDRIQIVDAEQSLADVVTNSLQIILERLVVE